MHKMKHSIWMGLRPFQTPFCHLWGINFCFFHSIFVVVESMLCEIVCSIHYFPSFPSHSIRKICFASQSTIHAHRVQHGRRAQWTKKQQQQHTSCTAINIYSQRRRVCIIKYIYRKIDFMHEYFTSDLPWIQVNDTRKIGEQKKNIVHH